MVHGLTSQPHGRPAAGLVINAFRDGVAPPPTNPCHDGRSGGAQGPNDERAVLSAAETRPSKSVACTAGLGLRVSPGSPTHAKRIWQKTRQCRGRSRAPAPSAEALQGPGLVCVSALRCLQHAIPSRLRKNSPEERAPRALHLVPPGGGPAEYLAEPNTVDETRRPEVPLQGKKTCRCGCWAAGRTSWFATKACGVVIRLTSPEFCETAVSPRLRQRRRRHSSAM